MDIIADRHPCTPSVTRTAGCCGLVLASVGDGRMLGPRRCSATASLRGVAGVTEHAGMGEDAMADDVAELVVLG